jgi:hypothetical protein
MNTVMNGAWPFVVMRVTTWYWMVWTPRDLVAQALLDHCVDLLGRGLVSRSPSLIDRAANLLAGDVDKGREVRERDGLAAVLAGGHLGDDLRGDVAGGGEAVRRSMSVPEMTVPFCSMSSRLMRSQLCMCCA